MAGVNASAQLREIAVALKEAGDRGNLNAMRRGIRAEAAPLILAVRDAARRQLPKSGGLAEYEASQKMRTSVLTSVRTTAVRVVGKASLATTTGKWRHPDPSMRGYDRSYWKWVEQTYYPAIGWWSRTLAEKSPEATALIEAELERVAAKIRAI